MYPDALFLQIIKVYFLFMVLLDSDFSRRKGLYKMTIEMLKGKIHRATVIQAELDYVGSITVDEQWQSIRDIHNLRKTRKRYDLSERSSSKMCKHR